MISIKNGIYSECLLDGDGIFENMEPKKAAPKDFKQLMISENENGYLVLIEMKARENDLHIPLFDTLRETLQKHVSLRDIMTSPRRIVKLCDINLNREEILSYRYPVGTSIHKEMNVEIPGYPDGKIDVEIFKAEEELSQAEEGYTRDGGLVIRSGTAIHDSTLFRYDSDKYARKLYGTIRCEYIDKLIIQEEARHF